MVFAVAATALVCFINGGDVASVYNTIHAVSARLVADAVS